MNRASVYNQLNMSRKALRDYQYAIGLHLAMKEKGQTAPAMNLALLYMNKASVLSDWGRPVAAAVLLRKACVIFRRMYRKTPTERIQGFLVTALMQLADSTQSIGDVRQALVMSSEVMARLDQLLETMGIAEYGQIAVVAGHIHSEILLMLHDPEGALRTILHVENQVNRLVKDGQADSDFLQANVFSSHAMIASALDQAEEAEDLMIQAVNIVHRQITEGGLSERLPDWGSLRLRQAELAWKDGKRELARELVSDVAMQMAKREKTPYGVKCRRMARRAAQAFRKYSSF
ncbi:hypothetical protein JXA80_13825 [bacterium]|nr:hypothetical protein [candidate division CSSED10-310 bacterium]